MFSFWTYPSCSNKHDKKNIYCTSSGAVLINISAITPASRKIYPSNDIFLSYHVLFLWFLVFVCILIIVKVGNVSYRVSEDLYPYNYNGMINSISRLKSEMSPLEGVTRLTENVYHKHSLHRTRIPLTDAAVAPTIRLLVADE